MAERDTLLSTLPDEARAPAEILYDQSSDPDPHDIVAELHRQGLLRDDQLRDALLALQGSLRSVRMRARPPGDAPPTILGPLGAGAMGEVLVAKDEALNRLVAVKRLLPELVNRPSVVDRFYREAQITAQLDHPSIVPIHSLVSESGGSLAYTMKLVQGRTLEAYLDEAREQWKTSGRESGDHLLTARLERFLQICDAVAYANERGVVHRDLKPENVMVGAFGQVLVMDWGIAKVIAAPEVQLGTGEELRLPTRETKAAGAGTRVGAVFGTPRYMSPEQAVGANDTIDGRSDQYTLGLILQEVVTLQPAIPESLETPACVAWATAARRRPMAHVHPKGRIPRELVAIVDKATQKDPNRRYRAIPMLAEDVRRYLRDEAVSARPDTLLQRVHRWVGHHRTAVLSLVSFLAMLVVAVGSTLLLGGIAVLEWRREVAQAHEDAITNVLGLASGGAGKIHHTLDTFEQALIGLSYVGEGALDPKDSTNETFTGNPLAPPTSKLHSSAVYGREILIDQPTFSAPDTSEAVTHDASELLAVAHSLARPLLDSASDEGKVNKQERFNIVGKHGAPVRWARIATSNGLLAVLPWTGPFRDDVDARKLPWYRSDRDRVLKWIGPHVDPDGTGLILTATRPLLHLAQEPFGTAAIDVTAQTLCDLLVPPAGSREAMLVDPNGQVALWYGLDAPKAKDYTPRDLPVPDLKGPISARPAGFWEGSGVIAAWSPVELLGWRYLILVDASAANQLPSN